MHNLQDTVAQTSLVRRGMARTRGITLIEMSVVVVILAIMATLIAGNYSRIKEGQDQRAFASDLRSEVSRASVHAITNGTTVTLAYDPAQGAITLSEITVDPNADPSQAVPVNQMSSQQTTNFHSLAVPQSVTIDGFKVGTVDQGAGAWQVQFFPDGRSEGGAIQLNLGNSVESLLIDGHGETHYVDGNIPDTSTEIWQAGDLQTRNG